MKKFGPGKHKCSKQSPPQGKEDNAKAKDGRPSVSTLHCNQLAAEYGCDWLGVLVDNVVHVDDSLISSIRVMRWQCWGCTTNFDRTYNMMKSRGFVCSTCNASQCKQDKKRAGKAGSKEKKQRAGQAGGVVASREDKQRAGQAGSKEDKQRAGQAGSKEKKQRAGQAGGVVASREDKQRAGQASPKKDKQRAGQTGGQADAKEDKQRAGQAGAVRRALTYARETLASQSTQAIQHMWERGDEIEPSGSVVDEDEEAMLQSVAGPSTDEFTGSNVGTYLAATVRGFWELTGMDRFPVQPAVNLESCEPLEALVRAILDEKVGTADMVALAKEWHKKVGVCDDIQSCGCCGVRDFQQVKEVEVSKLDLLKLDSEQVSWYHAIPIEYRKYAAVFEQGTRLYWLHHDLVSNGVVQLCNSCHRSLFHPKKGQVPPNAIASGKHFGKRCHLPELTDLEERMLGRVRTTVNTVKLVSAKNGATSQWGVRGHAISVPHDGPEVLAARLPDVEALVGTKVIFVGPRRDAEAMRRDQHCKERVERIFTPRGDRLVQWLRVLKVINPEYASVEILEVAPPEVVDFPNAIFDNMSIGDHPDVIAAEKQSGADIAAARKGDLDDGEVISDVVVLSDGALLNRDGNDVPQVLQSIKEMLAARRSNIVRREEVAMNEFEANDRLLTLSFPSLFMFGSGIKRPCGVSEADTRHMLLQYDNRFAEARDFCLLLFNQKFRHTALRSVRDAIYANPNGMKAFETAINTPNLEEDLKKAEANPQGKEARHLVHTFMPLFRTCHAAVPFSTSERYAVMGKMNSMMLFFGPPSLFYAVAPNDIDNELSLCLSMGDRQARVPLPEVSRRFEALSKNPVAAARIFERQVRTFLEVLLGLPSSKQTKKDRAVCNRKKGLFGTCAAHCTCYECQGRGSLHFHGLFWGGIPPWLLDMVVGNSELVKAVAIVLDQQICAALDAHIHRDYEHRLKHKVDAPRMLEEKQLLPPLSDDPHEAAREIEQFASKVFGHIQFHRCLIASCGKPPGGKSGCRFGLPRAAGEGYSETRPRFFVAYHTPSGRHNIRMYDSEVEFDANDENVSCVLVIWELRRPHPCDGRVVETNKLLTYLYASNTNVQFLRGEDVLVAVAKYVVGYCSKNPVKIANVLSTIRQVTREVDKMDTTEFAQPGEKEALMLKRIINSLDKKVEFSAQMAAVSLLGYPSWHCSHKFAVVHPWSTVATIPTLFSGMLEDGGGESTSDDEHHADMHNICVDAPSISSSGSDVVDDDPLATSNVDMQQASQTPTHPPPNDNGTGSSEDEQEDKQYFCGTLELCDNGCGAIRCGCNMPSVPLHSG